MQSSFKTHVVPLSHLNPFNSNSIKFNHLAVLSKKKSDASVLNLSAKIMPGVNVFEFILKF